MPELPIWKVVLRFFGEQFPTEVLVQAERCETEDGQLLFCSPAPDEKRNIFIAAFSAGSWIYVTPKVDENA